MFLLIYFYFYILVFLYYKVLKLLYVKVYWIIEVIYFILIFGWLLIYKENKKIFLKLMFIEFFLIIWIRIKKIFCYNVILFFVGKFILFLF